MSLYSLVIDIGLLDLDIYFLDLICGWSCYYLVIGEIVHKAEQDCHFLCYYKSRVYYTIVLIYFSHLNLLVCWIIKVPVTGLGPSMRRHVWPTETQGQSYQVSICINMSILLPYYRTYHRQGGDNSITRDHPPTSALAVAYISLK